MGRCAARPTDSFNRAVGRPDLWPPVQAEPIREPPAAAAGRPGGRSLRDFRSQQSPRCHCEGRRPVAISWQSVLADTSLRLPRPFRPRNDRTGRFPDIFAAAKNGVGDGVLDKAVIPQFCHDEGEACGGQGSARPTDSFDGAVGRPDLWPPVQAEPIREPPSAVAGRPKAVSDKPMISQPCHCEGEACGGQGSARPTDSFNRAVGRPDLWPPVQAASMQENFSVSRLDNTG